MNDSHPSPPDKTRCIIQRLEVNFDDPGKSTKQYLKQLDDKQPDGICFVNPMFAVYCKEFNTEFLQAIERCQQTWFRVLSRRYGNHWRTMRNSLPEESQETDFDGIVRTDGIPMSGNEFAQQLKACSQDHVKVEIRPDVLNKVQSGDSNHLLKALRMEVESYKDSTLLHPDVEYYLFPHLTLKSELPCFLKDRISKERKAWQHTLYRHLGKREFYKLPKSVKSGIALNSDTYRN